MLKWGEGKGASCHQPTHPDWSSRFPNPFLFQTFVLPPSLVINPLLSFARFKNHLSEELKGVFFLPLLNYPSKSESVPPLLCMFPPPSLSNNPILSPICAWRRKHLWCPLPLVRDRYHHHLFILPCSLCGGARTAKQTVRNFKPFVPWKELVYYY